MGYSTVIAAAFAAIIMLTGLATILTTGITSLDSITSSINDRVVFSEAKLGEGCELGRIREIDPHTYRVNVTNTGDVAFSVGDLSGLDLLAVYLDASGRATSWLPYEQAGAGEHWKVAGVYLNGGEEVTNPASFGATSYGVWDPLETMEVELHISATATKLEFIILTLPGGFRAIQSTALTINNGQATIVRGQTTVTVAHGLSGAPTNIQLTPEAQVNGAYWVSNVNDSTFQIHLSHSQSGDISFYWYCQK